MFILSQDGFGITRARSGNWCDSLASLRPFVEVSKFKVLGTWVLKGDLFIQNRFWVLGYLKGICSYRTDWEHRTEGVPPHILLSMFGAKIEGQRESRAPRSSVAGKHAAKRGKVRPRRSAGQSKVKLSGIRIGL